MEKYDFDDLDGFDGEVLSRGSDFEGRDENAGKCVSSRRGDVYYFVTRRAGENARWLVLTHGLGMDHTVFDGAVERFSPFFNIITWDMPHHGMSEIYGDFSFDGCALDLKAIMDAVGADTAFIGGHCIGGCAAQAFADAYPEKCLGLILIDTFPFGRKLYPSGGLKWLEKPVGLMRAMPSKAIATAMAGLFAGTAEGERALKKVMSAQNTARVMDVLAAAMDELPERGKPEYAFPVLDIVGENDRLDPIRQLNESASSMCGYIHAVIPHAGHTPYLDNPEGFRRVLEEFLR